MINNLVSAINFYKKRTHQIYLYFNRYLAENYSDPDDPVVEAKQVEKSKGRQQQYQR
jgi:hypothetical protein